jgi:hypothetical protein
VSIVVDIQTVSIVIASASVIAGVIYYALQIRDQNRMRQTDLLLRLYSTLDSREYLEAWYELSKAETIDANFIKEHGTVEVNKVSLFFDELGILLQRRLLDITLIDALFHRHVQRTWEKIEPFIKETRKTFNFPQVAQGFEYLYNEMKKREQQLAKTGENFPSLVKSWKSQVRQKKESQIDCSSCLMASSVLSLSSLNVCEFENRKRGTCDMSMCYR